MKVTKTNQEMPLHRVVSQEEAQFIRDAAKNAPRIPAGIYEVARIGVFPNGLTFCQTTDYKFFKLSDDLLSWAVTTVDLGLRRLLTFPCKIEFGYGRPSDGRAYADFCEDSLMNVFEAFFPEEFKTAVAEVRTALVDVPMFVDRWTRFMDTLGWRLGVMNEKLDSIDCKLTFLIAESNLTPELHAGVVERAAMDPRNGDLHG